MTTNTLHLSAFLITFEQACTLTALMLVLVKKLVHRPGQRRKRKSETSSTKAAKQGKAREGAKNATMDAADGGVQ